MTTRTVAWALTWEYWRRGTIWLVPAVAGLVIACTGLLYTAVLFAHWPPLLRSPGGTRCGAPGVRHSATCGVDRRVLCRVSAALCPADFDSLVCRLHVGKRRSGSDVHVLDRRARARELARCRLAIARARRWAATVYVVLQSLAWQAGRSHGLLILLMGLFLVFAMPLGVEYLLPNLLPLNHLVGLDRIRSRSGSCSW